jgi:ubiquinone/menaquinone biosynthesis C-methylase UbiE
MAYFEDNAAAWDTPRRVERAKVIADKIYQAIMPNRNGCALEYGCGTGLISFFLSERLSDITLIDSSAAMIEQFEKKRKPSNMRAIVGDIVLDANLPQKYNSIYSSMAFHHIKDIADLLIKLYNSLEQGGILCVVDLDKDDGRFHSDEVGFDGHNGFSHCEMYDALCFAGFSNVNIETFYRAQKGDIAYSLFCASGIKL